MTKVHWPGGPAEGIDLVAEARAEARGILGEGRVESPAGRLIRQATDAASAVGALAGAMYHGLTQEGMTGADLDPEDPMVEALVVLYAHPALDPTGFRGAEADLPEGLPEQMETLAREGKVAFDREVLLDTLARGLAQRTPGARWQPGVPLSDQWLPDGGPAQLALLMAAAFLERGLL